MFVIYLSPANLLNEDEVQILSGKLIFVWEGPNRA